MNLTFLPDGISVVAQIGDTILDAAMDNGIALPHDCGGNCACTTCHVIIEVGAQGLSPMEEVESDRLDTASDRTSRSRLGCQAILLGGDLTARIVEVEGW